MQENDIGDNSRRQGLSLRCQNRRCKRLVETMFTSAGPAPTPLKTAAPMKPEYDDALAFQTKLPMHSSVDANSTNLRPKVLLKGTLQRLSTLLAQLERNIMEGRRAIHTYQKKLLNPKTRIVTPVKWTTPARSESKS